MCLRHMTCVFRCRQQKESCPPVRVNGARDITRLMAQTAIQVICLHMHHTTFNLHKAQVNYLLHFPYAFCTKTAQNIACCFPLSVASTNASTNVRSTLLRGDRISFAWSLACTLTPNLRCCHSHCCMCVCVCVCVCTAWSGQCVLCSHTALTQWSYLLP